MVNPIEQSREMEVWQILMNTLVRMATLLVLAGLTWNRAGPLMNFLLRYNVTRLALLYAKGPSRAQLFAWLQDNLPTHDLTLHGEKTIWKNGSLLCYLVNIVVPDACLNPFCHQGQTPAHGQVLAYKYLGVPPAFSEEELNQSSFTTKQEKKLIKYLSRIKITITHFRESVKNMKFCTDYVAKGMGLVAGEKNKKASFFIYSIPKKYQTYDITVTIRGPYGTTGQVTVPAIYQQKYQSLTDYKRALYMSSKLNSISPTLQGTSFLRKLNIDFGGVSTNDIQIRIKMTKTHAKISYLPKITGLHEITLHTNGYHLIGSPFGVPIETQINTSILDTIDDDKIDKIRIKKRFIPGIVDVVGEKMFLKENGVLEKIPTLEHEIIYDKKIRKHVDINENNNEMINTNLPDVKNNKFNKYIDQTNQAEISNAVNKNNKEITDDKINLNKKEIHIEKIMKVKSYQFQNKYSLEGNADDIFMNLNSDERNDNSEITSEQNETNKNQVFQAENNDRSIKQIYDLSNDKKAASDTYNSAPDILENNTDIFHSSLNTNSEESNTNMNKFLYNMQKTFSKQDPSSMEKIYDSVEKSKASGIHSNDLINKMVDLFQSKQNNDFNRENTDFQIDKNENIIKINKKLTKIPKYAEFMRENDPDLLKCHGTKNNQIYKLKNYTHSDTISNYPQQVKEYKLVNKKLKQIGVISKQYDKKQRFLKCILIQNINKKTDFFQESKNSNIQPNGKNLEEPKNNITTYDTDYEKISSNIEESSFIKQQKNLFLENTNKSIVNKTENKEVKKLSKQKFVFFDKFETKSEKSLKTDYKCLGNKSMNEKVNLITEKLKNRSERNVETPKITKSKSLEGIVNNKIKIFNSTNDVNDEKIIKSIKTQYSSVDGLVENNRKLFEAPEMNDNNFNTIPNYNSQITIKPKIKTDLNTKNLIINSSTESLKNSDKKTEVPITFPTVEERKALLLKSSSLECKRVNKSVELHKQTNENSAIREERIIKEAAENQNWESKKDLQETKTEPETMLPLHNSADSSNDNKKLTTKRKARFERAKLFFKTLEGSKTKVNTIQNIKTEFNSDIIKVQRSLSAPCLENIRVDKTIDKNKHILSGSMKSIHILERFYVSDLFRDILGDSNRLFQGIPNRKAVVATLASLDQGSSKAECYKTVLEAPDAPQSFQEEYPHLPKTYTWKYKPRSINCELIPRKMLLVQTKDELFI